MLWSPFDDLTSLLKKGRGKDPSRHFVQEHAQSQLTREMTLTSSIIREMQIRVMMRCHLLEWPRRKTDSAQCWQGYGGTGTPAHCENGRWQIISENSLTASYKGEHIPVYPRMREAGPRTKVHADLHSSIIRKSQKWKRPNSLSPSDRRSGYRACSAVRKRHFDARNATDELKDTR